VMNYSAPSVASYTPGAVYVSPSHRYYTPAETYSWTPVRRSYYVAPAVYQSSYEPAAWVWRP
jgi:hypothetical protein